MVKIWLVLAYSLLSQHQFSLCTSKVSKNENEQNTNLLMIKLFISFAAHHKRTTYNFYISITYGPCRRTVGLQKQ